MTRSNFAPAAVRLRRLLRELRLRAGLTQTALAQRLNYPQQWVYKYEAGERRLDVIEFIQIARAIGFKPGEFLDTLMDEPFDLDTARPGNTPRPALPAKTRT